MWARAVGHHQAAEPDADEDHQHHLGYDRGPAALDDLAEGEHRQDKADGTPQPDGGVTADAAAEMIEGNHLHLRQRCVPEEAEQDHHQGHFPETLGEGDAGEDQEGEQGRKPDDGHARVNTVADPAPDIGRDDLGAHEDRHELSDGNRGKAPILQIQAPERDQRAESGEVEEVEAGEAPIRHEAGPMRGC